MACGEAAHPRVSGENQLKLRGWFVALGSSPRERGKPVQAALDAHGQGLIPA